MSRKSSPNHSSPEVTRDAPSNSSLTREATPDKIKILDSFNSSAGATYSGSPGHTPFPKAMPIKLFNDDSLGDASISIESSMATSANESGGLIPAATPGTSSESFHLPKVPFNSPDEVDNNEAIIAEAKRQEELLRESLTADNLDLLLAGQSPSLSAKRRKIDFIKETREDLNEDANKESKFVPVTWESLVRRRVTKFKVFKCFSFSYSGHSNASRNDCPGTLPVEKAEASSGHGSTPRQHSRLDSGRGRSRGFAQDHSVHCPSEAARRLQV